ncbi:MAG: hypothetical protein JO336_19035 [Acidobacteriia bacterium]|nr:hypothetical protein [Terriglobia bacterium]MBV8905900.1 hypothetical protein [Terriglobia bacterium]MBV9743851.1 hypothetical protein [Terriglobia bacterium]
MSPDLIAAIISPVSSAAVAITALLLNQRGFTMIENRITDMGNRMTNLENRMDRRLEAVEADLKEFFKAQTEFDKRLGRIEDKLGIPPR